ncbi:hypothetical protein KFE96_07550 [Kordiimonas sp. SCSIO 12603]|uniref:hypothetical protein n=1 Tax=Kordiimonas sp. SCSIO 12603 TaxID=2829596 RepID=UPI0021039A9D|nr:hypothetical protein [Kordiimonas sp. SCSIO 12603]UTW60157.1 hypothetical protein KFE96_07550 [Kordiimonas sp. SCSIO 12603]
MKNTDTQQPGFLERLTILLAPTDDIALTELRKELSKPSQRTEKSKSYFPKTAKHLGHV